MNDYSDIINLPHHISKKHPSMSNLDRAAQFSSFAALTGYEEAVDETARLTDKMAELNEEQIADINQKMNMLIDNISQQPEAELTVFVPDEKKDGGKYITLDVKIRKIDLALRTITDVNNNVVNIDFIYKIKLKNETR